ncbi:hypothetical protein WBJ53_18790 [Spirosoma sp. SC4-14]|uniref:hypothetical protein n=1 Tax=Spirosoma sp. SC4-14 TaxID=3128900 RepID=UPI0030CD4F71
MILFFIALGLLVALAFIYLYRTISFSDRCPRCKRLDEERIPRKGLAKILSYLVPLRAYRCRKCWNRYIVIDRSKRTAS